MKDIKIGWTLIHPMIAGIFAFLTTITGAYFFKSDNEYYFMALGLALFMLISQVTLKFQFNSYQLNGATITTIIIFLTQSVCLTFWKKDQITLKWFIGAIMILVGSILVKLDQDEVSKV